MSLYFFHFVDGTERSEDDIGIECASVEEAYLEAYRAAEAIWAEMLSARSDPRRCAFEIASGETVLMRLDFSELLEACVQPDGARLWNRDGLAGALALTHQRATIAKEDLRAGLDEVRQALSESAGLLARLEAFAPRSRYGWRAAG